MSNKPIAIWLKSGTPTAFKMMNVWVPRPKPRLKLSMRPKLWPWPILRNTVTFATSKMRMPAQGWDLSPHDHHPDTSRNRPGLDQDPDQNLNHPRKKNPPNRPPKRSVRNRHPEPRRSLNRKQTFLKKACPLVIIYPVQQLSLWLPF